MNGCGHDELLEVGVSILCVIFFRFNPLQVVDRSLGVAKFIKSSDCKNRNE